MMRSIKRDFYNSRTIATCKELSMEEECCVTRKPRRSKMVEICRSPLIGLTRTSPLQAISAYAGLKSSEKSLQRWQHKALRMYLGYELSAEGPPKAIGKSLIVAQTLTGPTSEDKKPSWLTTTPRCTKFKDNRAWCPRMSRHIQAPLPLAKCKKRSIKLDLSEAASIRFSRHLSSSHQSWQRRPLALTQPLIESTNSWLCCRQVRTRVKRPPPSRTVSELLPSCNSMQNARVS